MYIDFFINQIDISDNEAKELVKKAVDLNVVNSITIPYYLIRSLKSTVLQHPLDFSCLIDYPLGVSDAQTRLSAIEQAIKAGINTIDITIPQNLAANRKYDKIREDIKNVKEIVGAKNILIRYLLEYRVFDHSCLKKICEIFDDFGIEYIYPSTGYFIDNLSDNILASVFLYKNSKNLKIISSANIWSNKHFEILKKSGLFGFRANSIYTLQNLVDFNLSPNK
jgi:deoxyribose-phosphate aldolase